MQPPSSRFDPPDSPATQRAAVALAMSRAVVLLFVVEGHCDFSGRQLADHLGISERTFYRYFANKEDVVRPFLHEEFLRFMHVLEARPADEAPVEAMARSYELAYADFRFDESQAVQRVLKAHDVLAGVVLHVDLECEALLAAHLERRLGLEPGSRRARLLGALVGAAARIAMTEPDARATPLQMFRQHLELLGTPLFETGELPWPTTRPRRRNAARPASRARSV